MVIFWSLITFGALAWYIITTFIIGVRGYQDIKNMLKAISKKKEG
ncbi:hypothetical protein [Clostridium fallax]|uniref:Uncharacterized protein n=1 Tax=Clostridium fallax TaxID=1533 RepID=A0A1M4ZGH6_9CLOT|nr:hypothetical protein [Clostridium fallax]SHF16686.1 hypothetical protein SAMN05443638_1457 [Clostridium fallax]SQB22192.1 Uncharacterised protein [Clostridium fallax]